MWDEIQIQCCDAYEIAEALINNEVSLVQLESVPVFAAKARLVEEAVWDFCKSNNTISEYLKYLNIYPHSIHAREVDDRVWNLVQTILTIDACRDYPTSFPNGNHADWNYRKSINTIYRIDQYLKIFPNGIHAGEAKGRIAETLINNDVESITQLRSIAASVDVVKEDMVEEYVWNLCESKNTRIGYLIYINIYPHGIHACEADDRVFQTIFTIDDCRDYMTSLPNGNHAEEVKMLLQVLAMEEEAWQIANRTGTIESYQSYMDSYPTYLYCYPRVITHLYEAKVKIAELMHRIIRALSEDRNAYSLKYIKACGITVDDLRGKTKDSKGQVRDEVLKSWDDIPEVLLMDTMPTHLPQGVPEVYVWGMPRSGKTCALAAILNTINTMGCLGPCEGYVKQLSTLFIPECNKFAVCLPTVSTCDPNRYLPITLNEKVTDRKGGGTIKQHNLSVIEISGDIFECFSREIQGEPIKSKPFEEIYSQLKAFLTNTYNPKYHFFILDGNRMQDPVQLDYWQRAACYFQKGGVFNKATLGISLIVTKSDLLSPNRSEWVDYAKDHIMRYYASFVNTLKCIVGPYSLGLTDGSLRVIPFSIGEIFFKDLCIFNPESAKVLVDLLMCYADEGEKEWRWRNKGIRLHSFLKNGMGGIDECLDSIEKRGFRLKGKSL